MVSSFEAAETLAKTKDKAPGKRSFRGRGLRGREGDFKRHKISEAQQPVIVRSVMRPNGVTLSVAGEKVIQETGALADALRLMRTLQCDRLSVVDSDHSEVGSVTLEDVVSRLSPERLYIDLNDSHRDQNILRHKARYLFALNQIRSGGKVLDCACGAGYGASILAEKANQVLGVDNSIEAIEFADSHYACERACFLLQDLQELNFGRRSLDSVVSLETLEHIPKESAEEILLKINRWLRPGGVLVASSPLLRYQNGHPYITSPYHVNELPRDELLATFERCLPDMTLSFYHQKEQAFTHLEDEDTGFCLVVAKKNE